MDKLSKIAALYISTLRAIGIIHQNNHWLSKGTNFYGSHLLFERIYKSSVEDLDLAAEKFVGLFGPDCLDYKLQADLLSKVISKYNELSSKPFEQSLAIEKEFLKLSQDAYNSFKSEGGKLSLGLDDLIMSISSSREESVYLLQQSLNDI